MRLVNELLNALYYQEFDVYEAWCDMRDAVLEGQDPEDVCYDWGLEPDYAINLIFMVENEDKLDIATHCAVGFQRKDLD